MPISVRPYVFGAPVPFAGSRELRRRRPALRPYVFGAPIPFVGPRGESTAAITVYATDAAYFSDGRHADSAGFSVFDDFEAFAEGDAPTPLEAHAPIGGGSWAKHPLYAAGGLLVGLPDAAVASGAQADALYLASRSASDGKVGWTTGDVGPAEDVSAIGCGLRVSATQDAGYFGLAKLDSGVATWAIVKRIAGVETVLASASRPAVFAARTRVELAASGTSLTLTVDGSPLLSATDSAISGSGRYAMLYRFPGGIPADGRTYIDDVFFGPLGSPTHAGPETVAASLADVEAAWAGFESPATTSWLIVAADWCASADAGTVGEPVAPAAVLIYATDSATVSDALSLSASLYGLDSAEWSWATSTGVTTVVDTIFYTIYGNDSDGGAIDYSAPLGTTELLWWDTEPLATDADYRFGVRATSTFSGLEEQNTDAAVEIILDASGFDVTSRPRPITNLRAYADVGGLVQVEWGYPRAAGSPRSKPVGFNVYVGFPHPDYSTPVAVVSASTRDVGGYRATIADLIDGQVYAVAVRAFNATGEEPNPLFVQVLVDATPPAGVDGLTGTASESDS